MLNILTDNFVIFAYGIFPLTDFEHTAMHYSLYRITRHLAPLEVEIGSIWLSRILKCKKGKR
jgi:hypothetical protein